MVIDVQRDVVANALATDQVVANINSLIAKARSQQSPIIWVQHSDEYLVKNSAGWEFVPELVPAEGDVRIYKTHASSFEETDLGKHLNRLGTERLVITGAQTDFCVNATSNAAVALGFDVTLVSDAHTTEDTKSATAAELIKAKNEQFAGLVRGEQEIEVLPEIEVAFN
jgi:nicotinamidase-related amidase